MTPDLKDAHYVKDYMINLTFENGKSGIVDFAKFIDRGEIFSRLKDVDYFKNFSVDPELFILKWPDGLDIAPEVLYSEATGEPLPSWMVVRNDCNNVRR
ncbi:DUF2442 domain-containing protein [Chitinispirillales bacterium ANBcel5]|uniref:DUF2442 domain-containing protein n=1 Tax=Cellulosispirillum alkaliphilum TaxID=3039283 RepID=UPI002A5673A9|nr:DUF2442 domain-containing protein [Chitinispirillales bacterium ANBcel5]